MREVSVKRSLIVVIAALWSVATGMPAHGEDQAGSIPPIDAEIVPVEPAPVTGTESSAVSTTIGYHSAADSRSPWNPFPYLGPTAGPLFSLTATRAGEEGILDLRADYLSDRDYLVTLSADRAARYRLQGGMESFRRTVPVITYLWDPFATFSRDERNEAPTTAVTIRQNGASTRIKPFDYPFHLDLSVRTFEESGTRQIRFADVLFTGDPDTLYTRTRHLDRRVTEFRGGVDLHAGYVDLVNSFQFMTFDDEMPIPRDVTFVSRSRSGSPLRSGGLLQHNDDPDSRFWMNTTRLHTSISGGLVGAVSWSFGRRESMTRIEDVRLPSRPATDVTNLSADLSWQTGGSMQASLRYRRESVDASAPASLTLLTGAVDTVNGDPVPTPLPVDYVRQSLIATLLWHPAPRSTLKTEYRGEFVRRTAGMNGSTPPWLQTSLSTLVHNEEKHRGGISFQTRPARGVRLRGEYAVTGTVHPAYASTFDLRHEGILSVGYEPGSLLSLLADLRTAAERADAGGVSHRRGFHRKVDTLETSAGITPREGVSLWGTFSLQRERIDEPLSAGIGGGNELLFDSYQSTIVRTLSARGEWRITPSATVSAAYSVTTGVSGFSTENLSTTVFGSPASSGGVGSLAPRRIAEHQFGSSLDLSLTDALSAKTEWKWGRVKDRFDQAHEGNAHLLVASLSYRW